MDTYLDYAQAIREDMKYDLCVSVDEYQIESIIRCYEEMKKERKTCTHPYVVERTVRGYTDNAYCTICGMQIEELMGG